MDAVILISKEIGGGVEAPEAIQVIPYGYHDTPKGAFLCDEGAAALVMEEFSLRINDMVADYEHQTLSGAEAPAAGWIKELLNKGPEGIWARIEWNARAKEYIKNKEYRYVSPVFLKRLSDNRVIKLINVALTNQPNIDGMVPIVNKAVFNLSVNKEDTMNKKELCKALGLPEDSSDEAVLQMVNKLKGATAVVANKSVLDALGLKEGATEPEVVTAVTAMKQGAVVANKAVLNSLGLKEGATESEAVATVMAMKQGSDKFVELSTKVATLEQNQKSRDAEEMVNSALKDGKITADQKDWAAKYASADQEGFKVFIAKAPQVVPMGGLPKGSEKATGSGLDEAQVSVNKMLGLSDEAFKKHNPAKD